MFSTVHVCEHLYLDKTHFHVLVFFFFSSSNHATAQALSVLNTDVFSCHSMESVMRHAVTSYFSAMQLAA